MQAKCGVSPTIFQSILSGCIKGSGAEACCLNLNFYYNTLSSVNQPFFLPVDYAISIPWAFKLSGNL